MLLALKGVKGVAMEWLFCNINAAKMPGRRDQGSVSCAWLLDVDPWTCDGGR